MKTRLAVGLDDAAAAAIAVVLVDRTVGTLAGVGGSVELRYTPDDAEPEIARWRREGWVATPQGDGDLGQRLERAFASAFSSGDSRVVVIGTDCPGLTTEDLGEAFRILDQHEVVLGPTEDGGYWLLGLRSPAPELFSDIAWSTDTVFQATQEKALALGRSVGVLRKQLDVDTVEDWRRWLREQPL